MKKKSGKGEKQHLDIIEQHHGIKMIKVNTFHPIC